MESRTKTVRVALLAVVSGALMSTVAVADSIETQVTKSNIDSLPFVFKVVTEDYRDGTVSYRVGVASREDRERWCVQGLVRLQRGETLVGSFDIVDSGESLAFPEADWDWVYRFVVSRDYLEGSRFTFVDFDCSMPSFDGYWFDLEEFHDDQTPN
jgi:hypothetical protein